MMKNNVLVSIWQWMVSWWLTLSINLMVCNYGKNLWVGLWGSFFIDLREAGRLPLSVVSIRLWLAVIYGIIWRKQIKRQHVAFKHLDSEYRCLLILLQCFIYCDKLETSNCANIPSLSCFCQVTREQMKVISLLAFLLLLQIIQESKCMEERLTSFGSEFPTMFDWILCFWTLVK